MPVIKSAKKKLRQDKKRKIRNEKNIVLFKNLIKKAKKHPSEKTVRDAFKSIDKAAKNNIIHKNKAARLKSALSRLLSKKEKPGTIKHETKISVKKPHSIKKATNIKKKN